MTFEGRIEPWTRPCGRGRRRGPGPRSGRGRAPAGRTCGGRCAIASAKFRPATSSVTRQRWPCHSMKRDHLDQVGVGELRGGLEVGHERGQDARRRRGARRAASASPRCGRRSCPRRGRPSPRGPRPISSRGTNARRRGRRRAPLRPCGGHGGCGGHRGRGQGAAAGAAGAGAGGRRPRAGPTRALDVAELQVLGLDLLVDAESLRLRCPRPPGRPPASSRGRGWRRTRARRRSPCARARGRAPGMPGLDEEPRQQLGGGAVVLVAGRHPLEEGDRLLALARPRRGLAALEGEARRGCKSSAARASSPISS